MHPLIFLLLLAIFAAGLVTIWPYRVTIVHHWREPVLKYPVVIIESDDWGPGPAEQADRLKEIGAVLSRYGNPLQLQNVPSLDKEGWRGAPGWSKAVVVQS